MHLALTLLLAVCFSCISGCGGGWGGDEEDNGVFSVTSILPMNGATGVGLETNIEVYFSKEVDPNTLNSETISAAPAEGNASSSGVKATFTPSSSLTENTAYTITITTGIKDTSGTALDRAYTSEFTTGTTSDSGRGEGGDNVGTGGTSCGDGTCAEDETTASCSADCLADSDDYMWVAGNGGDYAAVFAKSGASEITNVATGSNPTAIAADNTYVWVANSGDGTVTRITKADLTTASITAASAGRTLSAIAVDDTYVWVVNLEPSGILHQEGEGTDDYVTRITKSNTSEKIDIDVEDNPVDVAVDGTYVWALAVDDLMSGGLVTRITRSDVSQKTNIPSGGIAPTALAVDDDSVWIVNSGPGTNITRIIKATQVATGTSVSPLPLEIAVDNTHVWVANLSSDTVTRFTKSGMSEQATINVGDAPRGISLDNTYVWVVNSGDGTVTRITKADSATTTISVGGYPTSKGDATGYNYARFF